MNKNVSVEGKQLIDGKAELIMAKIELGKDYTQDLRELNELCKRYDCFASDTLSEMNEAISKDMRDVAESIQRKMESIDKKLDEM